VQKPFEKVPVHPPEEQGSPSAAVTVTNRGDKTPHTIAIQTITLNIFSDISFFIINSPSFQEIA
jgi:hypothetical protein